MNQNGFRRNGSTKSQILTIRRILEGKPWGNNIISRLLQGIWFHTERKDGANAFLKRSPTKKKKKKKTVAALMMLYNLTKVNVFSPDVDTDYVDIVTGVLQGYTLTPYLFILCLDYMIKTSIDLIKETIFKLTKERSRRYSAQIITDADYADDIALLANAPAQEESQLHSLERAAGGIGLHVNEDKTEYMSFIQRGDISTLNVMHLNLVNKFTYLGNSVSPTNKETNRRLAKV